MRMHVFHRTTWRAFAPIFASALPMFLAACGSSSSSEASADAGIHDAAPVDSPASDDTPCTCSAGGGVSLPCLCAASPGSCPASVEQLVSALCSADAGAQFARRDGCSRTDIFGAYGSDPVGWSFAAGALVGYYHRSTYGGLACPSDQTLAPSADGVPNTIRAGKLPVNSCDASTCTSICEPRTTVTCPVAGLP
jgi:hypothetical protein